MSIKLINAKFTSKCADTGAKIKKGEQMYYDYAAKKCYCMTSKTATAEVQKQDGQAEAENGLKSYVQAQEDAFFDNWYAKNY
jgi:hypothetical protein